MFNGLNPTTLLRLLVVALPLATVTACKHVSPKTKADTKTQTTSTAAKVEKARNFNEPFLVEPQLGHARTHFRRHDYRRALLSLQGTIEGAEALFIAAESNFRLGNFDEARRLYEELVRTTEDPIERRKAQIRLFDLELKTKDTQSAIDRYIAFTKEYKKPPAQMRYGLGKLLYDADYKDRAEKILRPIPKDSEYYIRARYIVAALGMDKKKPDANVKIFAQIENLPPLSVEDHSVRQLAILAQGRIYAAAGKEDLAAKTYSRVALAGEFGETATIEAVRTMLQRAAEARVGDGRFKRASEFRRSLVESEAINTALATIARYRKSYEIDWRKPELLTLMAQLYVEARRYDDARLAYEELIRHYRRIYDELTNDEKDTKVWSYFTLNVERDKHKARPHVMVVGVPETLVRDIPEVKEILSLRDSIESGERKLVSLEEQASLQKISQEVLATARARQNGLANAYNAMVIKKQKRFKEVIAANVNRSLAEAEFKRAELVVIERSDLKKQQSVVHDFQSEKIEAFESDLKKLDEGGSL